MAQDFGPRVQGCRLRADGFRNILSDVARSVVVG
jgi:hypothetical protein